MRIRSWPAALALAISSMSCACSGEPSHPAAEPSPAARRSAEPAPAARPSAAPTCAPWPGAASVTAKLQAGRADFFRELHYDFKAGALRVHDSDPFASGQEASAPRVIQESKTLSAAERDRVERALFAVCPSPEAMARRCAPGGCMRVEIADASGKPTRIEDADTVRAVMQPLASLFPQLRAQ